MHTQAYRFTHIRMTTHAHTAHIAHACTQQLTCMLAYSSTCNHTHTGTHIQARGTLACTRLPPHIYAHIQIHTMHTQEHTCIHNHAHTHRDILMLACMRPHNLPAWMSPYTHTCMHAQNACMQGTLLHAHNTCTHMNARTDTAGTGLPSTLPRTSEEAEEEKVGTSFFSF